MDLARPTVHPIEAESYRILAERIDLSRLPTGPRAVIERVLHASADLEYARTMVVSEQAVSAGVRALQAGAPVITDGEMTRAGIRGVAAVCCLNDVLNEVLNEVLDGAAPAEATTRSALGIRLAADRHPQGALVVIGSAPTALAEVVALAQSPDRPFAPALVIGLPVGFVGAAEAKAAARATGLRVITNTGEKGGAAVAAAACNAIIGLAQGGGE